LDGTLGRRPARLHLLDLSKILLPKNPTVDGWEILHHLG
jgi:hypothetical protein